MKCRKWGCSDAKLIWMKTGESRHIRKGFLIAKIGGWYCPVCGGSYGRRVADEGRVR